jgi:hypothetical protein
MVQETLRHGYPHFNEDALRIKWTSTAVQRRLYRKPKNQKPPGNIRISLEASDWHLLETFPHNYLQKVKG